MVEKLEKGSININSKLTEIVVMNEVKELLILGASGHGKVVADIAKKVGYDCISFLDDNDRLVECGIYNVIGKCDQLNYYNCDMFVAIGDYRNRQYYMERIVQAGKKVVTLIHPDSVIADDVQIGVGTVVMAGTVINPSVSIGKGCIVNTSASLDHDCVVGDYAHVSVGVHVAGACKIGNNTWIGAGATVSNNVAICADCIIGAGAVVVKSIDRPGTYMGIPARERTMGG